MGILNGVIGIFKMLYEEGEKEWLDESKYRESLNELYVKVENGEITDEEYEEAERAILDHLRVVQEYKKEHDYTG